MDPRQAVGESGRLHVGSDYKLARHNECGHAVQIIESRRHKLHLVLNEPTDLPEGTVVELEELPSADTLNEAQLAQLDASLKRSAKDIEGGRVRHASEILKEL